MNIDAAKIPIIIIAIVIMAMGIMILALVLGDWLIQRKDKR